MALALLDSGRCFAMQRAKPITCMAASRSCGVMLYSTCGGTTRSTVPSTFSYFYGIALRARWGLSFYDDQISPSVSCANGDGRMPYRLKLRSICAVSRC